MMRWIACALLLVSANTLLAHPGHKHAKGERIVMINENFAEEQKTDGQGDWVFKYRSDLSTVPVEERFLLAAHGGFATDPATNITYFGLPGTGVIQISPDLTSMKVIGGDTGLFNPQGELWNYHNTCIVDHAGTKYLGLAGNNSGRVWVVGLDGKIHNTFTAPPEGNGQGATDLVQIPKSGNLKITYGYGDNFIYEASPFAGDLNQGVWNPGRFGGKGPREKTGVFNTPHGIALFPGGERIAIADRGYGRVQITNLEGVVETVWDLKRDDGKWPLPCDVNFSPDGTLAVVGNLDDANGKPANFLIVDTKTGKTLSSVTPATLGVPNSRHIHNTTFRYVDIGDGKTEVYVLCLFWNPGGYGVFQKVQPWHKPATT
ncbi:MAG: hypothetical protein K8Q97_01015 [Candidatus Andersenbacteria bacterium]|nr:hypothetical protein [Candidatus Andersenbacteria bacterium]